MKSLLPQSRVRCWVQVGHNPCLTSIFFYPNPSLNPIKKSISIWNVLHAKRTKFQIEISIHTLFNCNFWNILRLFNASKLLSHKLWTRSLTISRLSFFFFSFIIKTKYLQIHNWTNMQVYLYIFMHVNMSVRFYIYWITFGAFRYGSTWIQTPYSMSLDLLKTNLIHTQILHFDLVSKRDSGFLDLLLANLHI